jgi:hypothetical protein
MKLFTLAGMSVYYFSFQGSLLDLFFYDFIGLLGSSFIIICYLLLQSNKISSDSLGFSLFNTLGSLLIIISLYFNFNLSSFIIELFWILISLFGVFKFYKKIKNFYYHFKYFKRFD